MLTKRVWTPVDGKKLTAEERSRIIRSSMFLKEKYLASGEFEKLKARLVAGGDQQDKDMYDVLSAPTVSTSSGFTILSIAAHEGRKTTVVDIGGAFLNAEMKKVSHAVGPNYERPPCSAPTFVQEISRRQGMHRSTPQPSIIRVYRERGTVAREPA
jgi:hypothetical protein